MKLWVSILTSLFVIPSFAKDGWEWSLGGSFENTIFHTDSPAPSLLKFDEDFFYQPRLSLTLDVRPSDRWYFHARTRIDRGFDAADAPDGEIRLDEVFLRYQASEDQMLQFQVGKFATFFGRHVREHDFYDNPFLTAPLPYGEILGVGVRNPFANSSDNIAARANGTQAGVFNSPKRNWATPVWGPSYSTGAAVFGHIKHFDYAFEVKNVNLGAHPNQWDPDLSDFRNPTFSGRLGYRPSAEWDLGFSFSRGPYLNPEAERFLPNGLDRGDLPNTIFGLDARWAHGDFIISGEILYSQFERLQGEDLESLSWYLQARWKASPGFWLATRLGQTMNNEVRGPAGASIPWSPDLFRTEVAAGWRVTPDVLLKAQYSYTESSGGLAGPGENLFGFGGGWRF